MVKRPFPKVERFLVRRGRFRRYRLVTVTAGLLDLCRHRQEIRDEGCSVFGGDRFGVKLNTPPRPGLVPNGHDDIIGGHGYLFEFLGQWPADGQRVVADGLERAGDSSKKTVTSVRYVDVAMARRTQYIDAPTTGETHDLMTKTHAERRQVEASQDVEAVADVSRMRRVARTGRDNNRVECGR